MIQKQKVATVQGKINTAKLKPFSLLNLVCSFKRMYTRSFFFRFQWWKAPPCACRSTGSHCLCLFTHPSIIRLRRLNQAALAKEPRVHRRLFDTHWFLSVYLQKHCFTLI